ncbi:hypothetical protein ACS0TY_012860 [Phlomoides rotata]
MVEKVYKCLMGKRYLIVMDNIWSTKAWDYVRNIFPDDNNGSRIMFMIRLSDVAAYPISNGINVHEINLEEKAEECLEDLVRRSLVLVSRKVTGEIKSYSLHDLGPTIHTFYACASWLIIEVLPAFIGSFRLLRVLDVVCSNVGLLPLGTPDDIPATISNLHNLQPLIINPNATIFHNTNLSLEIRRMQ